MLNETLSFHSERRRFIACYAGKTSQAGLEDVILLPNKRILVTDSYNNSVKMFDIMVRMLDLNVSSK